jgi:hypothetical protein
MDEQAPNTLLHEHEVLFLDFLGFATAVQHWDDERIGELITALAAIADAQSEFDIKGERQSDGSYKITSPAGITTFSDHIVVSYPRLAKPAEIAGDLWALVSSAWDNMVRQQMQKISAQVAMAGLDVGLLMRGGLSRGTLYHRGRVVVGEGMIDAYRLESKVARTARVVVSPRIGDNDRLVTDTDGERCLDYFVELMLLAEDRHGNAQTWARKKLEQIEETIKGLTRSRQIDKAAKWADFRGKLRNTIETWPSSLQANEG